MIIVLQRCAVVYVGQFNSFRLGVIIIRFDGLVRARRFSGREPMMFIAAATRIASVAGAVLFSITAFLLRWRMCDKKHVLVRFILNHIDDLFYCRFMNQPMALGTLTTFDSGPTDDLPSPPPQSVRVIKILGAGRAARAQLVEATFSDGRTIKCVEKVFDPGRLTRTIYRLSFQSPFAYQKNRDAILTSFYRRRVASAILEASDIKCDVSQPKSHPQVATPLYVRFDSTTQSWVLAAQWVNGRGINPAPADPARISRQLRMVTTRGQATSPRKRFEIDELIDVMSQIEKLLGRCGLVGSGWQVSPRAIVSTANLLRVQDRYTVIDLESGIPAVLVPHYILSGLWRGQLPPFDDLDTERLQTWLNDNERLLAFRLGPDAMDQLRYDADKLIEHSAAWKQSEVALFRRPWRWLGRAQWQRYRAECIRRWRQDAVVDETTHQRLCELPRGRTFVHAAAIWCLGLLPSSLGRYTSRLAGRRDTRNKTIRFLRDPEFRKQTYAAYQKRCRDRWERDQRVVEGKQIGRIGSAIHRTLELITPASIHRHLTDPSKWRELVTVGLLLLLSRRYQSWLGQRKIESAITRWHCAGRISARQADQLRDDLCGEEVRIYTRGFGMHLALKAIAPVVIPAKVGGIAAFFATGNPWFLVPWVVMPVIRSVITWTSVWRNRHHRIPHSEALMTSWIPTFGSAAFLLQMFASRPQLSTFLIRDAASSVGRRVPIYGGADSRTEIAFIRATDFLIEAMQITTGLTQRIRQRWQRKRQTSSEAQSHDVLPLSQASRWRQWLDAKAVKRIADRELSSQESSSRESADISASSSGMQNRKSA